MSPSPEHRIHRCSGCGELHAPPPPHVRRHLDDHDISWVLDGTQWTDDLVHLHVVAPSMRRLLGTVATAISMTLAESRGEDHIGHVGLPKGGDS